MRYSKGDELFVADCQCSGDFGLFSDKPLAFDTGILDSLSASLDDVRLAYFIAIRPDVPALKTYLSLLEIWRLHWNCQPKSGGVSFACSNRQNIAGFVDHKTDSSCVSQIEPGYFYRLDPFCTGTN